MRQLLDSAIHLCLAAGPAHLPYAATTVASVCRRTRRRVHARVYVPDGDLPEAFSAGNLTVEFARPARPPGNCRLAACGHSHLIDQWQIVDVATDWDRCWILGTDQIVIADPADDYDTEFDGAWLAGRVGRTVAETSWERFGHDWPSAAPGGGYPVPYLGALCDLAAMRAGGFSGAIREVAEKWQADDQLAAAVAVAGRIREIGNEWHPCLGGTGHSESGVPGDLEWGCHPARVLHWAGTAKPWDDPSLPGAQLWLRELTDWEDLRHELAFRERDRHKVPALLIHLAGTGECACDTAGALEENGFGLEPARGCDPAYPFHLRGSVALFLEGFGWEPTRENMARVLSHRWAWQAFLQQSAAPYAVICEDGIRWQGTEAEMRQMGEGRGDGPWLIDLTGQRTDGERARPECIRPQGADGNTAQGEGGPHVTGGKPVCHDRPEAGLADGRAYCLSREAARLLVARDICHARALVNPHDPVAAMSAGASDRAWATGPSGLEAPVANTGSAAKTDEILVGICSCRQYGDKRQAVRETWFPRGVPGVKAVFFVGEGDREVAEPDTVCVPAPDTYDDLPAKVLAFFRHALEHYEFDWLFKCDDDTYLAASRLACLLEHGAEHVGNAFVRTRGAADGGAGYLLSRRLVELIAGDPSLALTGPEDVVIGEAAVASGASCAADGRLIRTLHPMPRWDNRLITCHRLSPRDLHTVHAFMEPPHNQIVVRDAAGHEDHILLHRHNRYTWKVAREAGAYEWRADTRRLILHRPPLQPAGYVVGDGNVAVKVRIPRADFPSSGPESLPGAPDGWGVAPLPDDIIAGGSAQFPIRIPVWHAGWRDTVELHEDGEFRRASVNDGGAYWWSGGTLALHWDQWAPERYVRLPDGGEGTDHYILDRVAAAFPSGHDREESGKREKFHAVASEWIGPVTLLHGGGYLQGTGLAGAWTRDAGGGLVVAKSGRDPVVLKPRGKGYAGPDCRLHPSPASFFGMWRDFNPELAIYRQLAGLELKVTSPWGDAAIPYGCRWDLLLSGELPEVRPNRDGFEWRAGGRMGFARWFVGTPRIDDPRAFHLPHFYDYWSRYLDHPRTLSRPRPGISFVASNSGPRRRIEVARQLSRWFRVVVSSGLRRHFADLPGVEVATVPVTPTGKLDFIANFTFNLCFENAVANGYLTEKPFQALWAGTVPVYEGDPEVTAWIDPAAMVDCSNLDASEIADRIRDAERAGVPEWVRAERERLIKVGLEEMTERLGAFLGGVENTIRR